MFYRNTPTQPVNEYIPILLFYTKSKQHFCSKRRILKLILIH